MCDLTIASNEIEFIITDHFKTTWVVDSKSFNLTNLGWHLKITTTQTIFGTCSLASKNICISANYESIESLIDTIKHEISHAIDFQIRGTSDHGSKWKSIAKQIGCVPKATHHSSIKNAKYTIVCINCNSKMHRYRISKLPIACKPCCTKYNDGFFSDKYLLKVVQNY